jgi:hypothetical protein
MALFSERVQKCARKVLDTADIVREAMLRQQSHCFRVADHPFSITPWLEPLLAEPSFDKRVAAA